MSSNRFQRNVLTLVIGAVLATGVIAPALAQDQGNDSQQTDQQRKDRRQQQQARQQEQAARQQQNQQRQQAVQQGAQQQQQAQHQQNQAVREQQQFARQAQQQAREQSQQQDRAAQQQVRAAQQQNRAALRQQEMQQRMHVAEQQQANPRPQPTVRYLGPPQQRPGIDPVMPHSNVPPLARESNQLPRLPQPEQQLLITQQQQRVATYRDRMQQRQPIAYQQIAQLQQQHRSSQYRFQQRYLQREYEQQSAFRNQRYDYDNDPYFYTAPSYRYSREGRDFEINSYGADLLRQAVNNGYEQGYEAGQADREDNWNDNYQDSYAYQDANYGYSGYYVDPEDYNYYFRQGFQRGYADGYNSRYEYGQYDNGSYSILGPVLDTILDLQEIGNENGY